MFENAIAKQVHDSPEISLEIALAALEGDTAKLRKMASQITQNYQGDDQAETKTKILDLLARSPIELRPLREPDRLPIDTKSRHPLVQKEEWPTDPLILNDELAEDLELTIAEISNAKLLEAEGLASRNTILLHGEPGTGKSLIAGHLAARLGRPLLTVRLDTLISSLLGDTAKNIRAIFEYAIASKAVLFLDEIDAVAKKRDDRRELGELKRIVNALLQGLDLIDSDTTIVAATNHAHMLDPAIWRRFPFQFKIEMPSTDIREALWHHYLFKDESSKDTLLLAKVSKGLTGSDIKEIAYASRKRAILTKTEINVMSVVRAILDSNTGEIVRPRLRQYSTEETARHFWKLNKEFKLTQPQIAKLANVSKQFVSKLLKSVQNTK